MVKALCRLSGALAGLLCLRAVAMTVAMGAAMDGHSRFE
jgi:hypothetical protein